jgi:hypothetical protein
LLGTASWRGPAAMDANCQMADFKRTFRGVHGNQHAQRAFEIVLDNMSLFRLEALNAAEIRHFQAT